MRVCDSENSFCEMGFRLAVMMSSGQTCGPASQICDSLTAEIRHASGAVGWL